MFKLESLTVHRLRNVRSGTSLEFSDSLNVLLGRNGTGKTTLMRLVSAIARSDFSEFIEPSFGIEYKIRGDAIRVHVMLNRVRAEAEGRIPGIPQLRQSPQFEGSIVATLSESNRSYVVTIGPAGVYLEHGDGQRTALELVTQIIDGKMLVPLSLIGAGLALEKENPDRRVLMSSLGDLLPWNAYRLDEALELLHEVTSEYRVEVVRKDGVATPGWAGFCPESVVQSLLFPGDEAPASPVVDCADIPELARCCELLGVKSISVSLSLRESVVGEEGVTHRYGNLEFRVARRDGSVLVHQGLSFGQQRLLMFFWYLANCEEMIVADELVNGFHYEWIESCIRAFGQRQVFLTSQNPLLLDGLPFDSSEQMRSCFVLCSALHEGDQETLTWERMEAAESDSFYRAYLSGIQHVGEILREKGLW